MPASPLVKDICSSSSECRTPAFWQSSLSIHRKSHTLHAFCTEHNVQGCLSHISQEVSSLGFAPICTQSDSRSEMNEVAALNCIYDLIQLHHRGLRSLENMEVEQMKTSSNADFLQLTITRLKEQLEQHKRENTGLLERGRQLQLKVNCFQSSLKNEKEEVQKLQNIISSRSSQYNHEMKRKEREFNKLKERLNQLLVDKKERKQAIDVLNSIGRADGKRSLWKTEKTEAKHEGEMYKTLLGDYERRQRELLQENAELNKVLQQMKKEMICMLSSRKTTLRFDKHQDPVTHADSEEEEDVIPGGDSSKDSMELYCVHAREKLTNSIRLQWRRLKSHVERLDRRAFLAQADESKNSDADSQEAREEEMDKLKLEVQQCKYFIQAQQQLLQQQLSAPCDEETAPLLSNSSMLQEKDRLREEWKTLEEQRNAFERERSHFTEAAIRLSHERKAFEEERATWLKHQFLNLSPFPDLNKPSMSKSKSAFSIAESNSSTISALEAPVNIPSETNCPAVRFASPSTANLYSKLCQIPEISCTKQKTKIERIGESSNFFKRTSSGSEESVERK